MRSGFHIPIISSKVVTDHAFAWESFSYINKYSKTEIFAFFTDTVNWAPFRVL